MKGRVRAWWEGVKDSLWFVPALGTIVGMTLALGLVRLDERLWMTDRSTADWLFGGGAEGARGVLSAIAGSMITVTGVVFSITIVALQLASGQFTPRVLRHFTGDRGNQVVLAIFIGTFTYALLVLRAVRSGTDEGGSFVPAVSVTVAIALALASIAALIFFIHHAARSIQASVIIDRLTRDTRQVIEQFFPAREDTADRTAPDAPDGPATTVAAGGVGGYVSDIDVDTLVALAEQQDLTIRAEQAVGTFVLPGGPLATVWPAALAEQENHADQIRRAFVLGMEQTLYHDAEWGVRQLADIAIRALSPGINDPTTAMLCIDRIGELDLVAATRQPPPQQRIGPDGRLLLMLPTTSPARLTEFGFAQIRHYGAGDPVVAAHLLATLGQIVALAPSESRAALVAQTRLVLEAAKNSNPLPADVAKVEQAAAWLS